MVFALLSTLRLPEQRHQPCHLQRHVSEVPCCLPQAVSLQATELTEASHIQHGTDLQCNQGDLQWAESRPLPHRDGGAPRAYR